MTGIYIITNEMNKKVYIGKAMDIPNRLRNGHYNTLEKNKHKNLHLQNSWNKWKEENFTFDILELCEKELLNEREIYWISYYESNNPKYGFNGTSGGDGVALTDKIREKMSKNNYMKGRTKEQHHNWRDIDITEEMINEVKNGMTRRKFNEKYHPNGIAWNRIRENLLKNGEILPKNKAQLNGNKNGMYGKTGENSPHWIIITNEMIEDVKLGITLLQFREKYNLGPTIYRRALDNLSELEKNNIIKTRKKRSHSQETKDKISKNSVGMKGKIHSNESKQKMSEARKGKTPGNKGKNKVIIDGKITYK